MGRSSDPQCSSVKHASHRHIRRTCWCNHTNGFQRTLISLLYLHPGFFGFVASSPNRMRRNACMGIWTSEISLHKNVRLSVIGLAHDGRWSWPSSASRGVQLSLRKKRNGREGDVQSQITSSTISGCISGAVSRRHMHEPCNGPLVVTNLPADLPGPAAGPGPYSTPWAIAPLR